MKSAMLSSALRALAPERCDRFVDHDKLTVIGYCVRHDGECAAGVKKLVVHNDNGAGSKSFSA